MVTLSGILSGTFIGAQGVQGSQGAQGVQGVQGSQGAQGVQGVQGSQGAQGVQGVQGSQGAQGVQGVQGSQGVQGAQGSVGAQGVQGAQGSVGAQGLVGAQGVQGVQGSFGPPTIPASTDTLGSGDTILGTDNGKLVVITGGLTIANVFDVGENVVIYNDTASQQTLTQGSGVTLRLSGTSLTGDRFIQQRGVATVLCVKTGEYAISGAGVT